MAADFRSFFGLSAYEVGKSLSYREAIMLTSELLRDPNSRLAAAARGWERPIGFVENRLTDLTEVIINQNRKKNDAPFHIDRPYEVKKKPSKRIGLDEAKAYFAKIGHRNTRTTTNNEA